MQKGIWLILFLGIGLISCSGEDVTTAKTDSNTSSHMFGEFFYPYDTIPKIYVYRNITDGLEERFHRVFSINDSEGKHTVVEIYTDDGRLLEALNYNIDSLDVIDHMVVNRLKINTKAELFKNKLMPENKTATASFASRFSGINDSTLFLQEIDRKYEASKKIDVLGKKTPTTVFHDYVRMTLLNMYTKTERAGNYEVINYFAKGYGLVEWHDPAKKAHYRLEKIISQTEFVDLMSN
jgi:hypothetical protein